MMNDSAIAALTASRCVSSSSGGSDGTCQYAADNREFDGGEPERVVVVDDGYLDMQAPIARERIARAGVRLAGLLNRALGDQSP